MDLEREMKEAMGKIWASLAKIISTVVSKAVLDMNVELKKPKVNCGLLVKKISSNTVRAIKECGLLDPSSSMEETGVQQQVWEEVFPQTPFPHPSLADSTPLNNMASQSSISI